jgi:hypothetical protein
MLAMRTITTYRKGGRLFILRVIALATACSYILDDALREGKTNESQSSRRLVGRFLSESLVALLKTP